ncbi:raffinose/stachyose/melibiose transport system permease protein [Microbacterium ginsengiterrae]|uniref:Raffinose/stachyose/melibiose transport system permease protein n=1 Tax=Microbacterium ginsengiterrae TaxID=546115 RepID=A0A7W9CAE2_9MICO|nr:sugar ABC transporter permease [Microbacterium ginsengiterrae]MBB5742006.1 raffinose/stachyose/melibiose transport system permease protein [Microbacterium ginsengiterrae]
MSGIRSAAAPTNTVGAAAPSPERDRRRRTRRLVRNLSAYALVVPAAAFYVFFVLRPIFASAQYSFYDWNGVGPSTWVGGANYIEVFTNPKLVGAILNAFELIIYFSIIPVAIALIAANIIRAVAESRLAGVARTVLFLPQVIPLVAAGIMWSWQLSTDGVVNQFLRLIGLDAVTTAWLGDFNTALPAVGVIGAWVQVGLCLVLILAGMTKIDPSLYEAARIDGAGPVREFFAITLPGVRQEIAVCVTVTVISALAAFDIIYISTQGGPGDSTLVPGLQIFYLAFYQRDIGTASAFSIVLMALVLIVVLPLQRILRGRES